MAKSYPFTYKLSDLVWIKLLNIKGRIVAIHLDNIGLTYKVRHFQEDDIKFTYFEESELESYTEDKESLTGFSA
jgi:hypothetical protein